jgi:hypothetical protein
MTSLNIFNTEHINLLRNLDRFAKTADDKRGFLSSNDPAFGAADPAAGGGDPAAAAGGAGGMDPSAQGAGGGPSPGGGGDPTSGGQVTGGTPTMADIQAMIQQALTQVQGGASGAGGPAKPKLDVAVELHRLNRMMAHLVDAQGLHVPTEEMVGDEDAVAQSPTGMGNPAASVGSAVQPGGGGGGGIQPMQPMPAAQAGGGGETKQGSYDLAANGAFNLSQRAAALNTILNRRNQGVR